MRSQAHDQGPRLDRREHDDVPRRLVAEGMPGQHQSDADRSEDAERAGGKSGGSRETSSQLRIAFESGNNSRAYALAQTRRRAVISHAQP